MLNEQVRKLLNEQVTKEFYSAYLYLDFADYYAHFFLADRSQRPLSS